MMGRLTSSLVSGLLATYSAFAADGNEGRAQELLASARPKVATLAAYVESQPEMTYNKRLALTALITAEYALFHAETDLAGESGIQPELESALKSDWKKKRHGEWLENHPVGQLINLHRILDKTLAAIKTDTPALNGTVFDPLAVKGDRAVPQGGNLTIDGKPVFPYGIVWFQQVAAVSEKYGARTGKLFQLLSGTASTPGNLVAGSDRLSSWAIGKFAASGKRAQEQDLLFIPWIGHKSAGWMGKAYPKFMDIEYSYVSYDISHPAGMGLVNQYLYRLGKAHDAVTADHVRPIYNLVNEPFSSIGEGKWNTQPLSNCGMLHFQHWLERKYGEIEALNASWEQELASFDEVSVETPVKKALRGTPVWYDIMRFNMARVTDYFQTAHDMIMAGDPEGLSTIKLMGWTFYGGGRSHGLDMEALCHVQDLLGADLHFDVGANMPPWRGHDERYVYAGWASQALFYDFCQSVCPDKPVYDSEFHGLATALKTDPAPPEGWVRSGLWAMHVTGVDLNHQWVWLRNDVGKVRGKTDRSHDFSDDPMDLFTYAKTMHEVNDLADVVTAFQKVQPRVFIYYSEDAAVQDAEYMVKVQDAHKRIYYSGVRPGFVTPRMLARDGAPNGLFVVPELTFVSDADLARLVPAMQASDTIYLGDAFAIKTAEGKERIAAALPESVEKAENLDLARIAPLAPKGIAVSTDADVPGVLWRRVEHKGKAYVFCLNMLSKPATVELGGAGNVREIVDGRAILAKPEFELKPGHMKLLVH
jgi:beta-galactosidase